MNELLNVLTSSATRKAQVSAVVSGVAVVLATVVPDLDDGAASIVTAILAVLAAFGVTWATPNRTTPDRPS